jgi:hypothetical protein
MNFSKYAAALAFFATAAYATADNKPSTENETPQQEYADNANAVAAKNDSVKTELKLLEIKGADLLKAYNDCKAVEANKTDELMTKCMEEAKVPKEFSAKALEELNKLADNERTDKAATDVIDTYNKDLTEAAKKTTETKSGSWFDKVNNVYGYIGGAVILAAIGGGIYLAVGRKSEDADL